MGRLAGFGHREVVARLRRFGFTLDRHNNGSHEIWRNDSTGRQTVVPKHRASLSEGTLRSILRQAAIDVDDFLA